MTPPEWSNLRVWKGSQNFAFEELCCQLARAETIPDSIKFVRKEAPDGGIECYWLLKDETQIGWQAKFFRTQLNTSQWGQVKKSLDGAVKKNPKLVKFIVCCPINLTHASIEKWNAYVETWTAGILKDTGRNIELDFWGESEIFDRLSKNEHNRGKLLFWFNKETLSNESMRNNIKEVIANVGARYTPKLNVELDIAQNFEVIGRTTDFHHKLRRKLGELNRATEMPPRYDRNVSFIDKIETVYDKTQNLLTLLFELSSSANSITDVCHIRQLARDIKDLLWDCESDARREKSEEYKKSHGGKEYEYKAYYSSERYDPWISYARKVYDKLSELYSGGFNSQVQLSQILFCYPVNFFRS